MNNRMWIGIILALFMGSAQLPAEELFSVLKDQNNHLDIFSSSGKKVIEIQSSAILQPVVIGDATFEVSYGKDAGDVYRAVFSPSPNKPSKLHFNALDKTVSADDKATVTLSFSSDNHAVEVDPGLVGSVQVTPIAASQNDQPHPASEPELPMVIVTAGQPGPGTGSPELANSQLSTPTHINYAALWQYASSEMSGMMVAQMPQPLLSPSAQPAGSNTPFYWSEPVTPPNGVSPTTGLDEIKLVEVQGTVTVKTPKGETLHEGSGEVIPSLSVITTGDHSSAALFFGGVDSLRMLPNSQITISQRFKDGQRRIAVDLEQGTVFSKVGYRKDERQCYAVRTADGVAEACGTEFADSVYLHQHYLFVAKGSVRFSNNRVSQMVSGEGDKLGAGVLGVDSDDGNSYIFHDGLIWNPGSLENIRTAQVLYSIMNQVQFCNTKIASLLTKIADEKNSDAEKFYMQNVKRIYFDSSSQSYPYAQGQVLRPFQVQALTPF